MPTSIGYFAGGTTGTGGSGRVATADKITFATDTTVAQASANLIAARTFLCGISECNTKGYFSGGLTSGASPHVVTTDKTTFSTDTTSSQASANLSVARNTVTGLTEGSTKGYAIGGAGSFPPNFVFTTCDVITFSTDTSASSTSGALSNGVFGAAAAYGGATKGYFYGGVTGNGDGTGAGVITTALRYTFSNDTNTSQTTAGLSSARGYIYAYSECSTKCYVSGGQTTYNNNASNVVTTDKTTFSTDTTSAQASANLSVARARGGATSDGTAKGFYVGGVDTSGTNVSTADKVTYSTDSTAAQTTANLTSNKQGFAGIGSDGGTTLAARAFQNKFDSRFIQKFPRPTLRFLVPWNNIK